MTLADRPPAAALVFQTLLAYGPLTRAETGRRTGLSPGAVTKAASGLLADGWITEAGRPSAERVGGRPATDGQAGTVASLVFSVDGRTLSTGSTDGTVDVWNVAKWPVMALVFLLMLAILYYASPNAKLRGFRWVTPGSLVAIAVWILASALFGFYVANFGSYDKTYGTLGGLVALLVWLWISNLAILFGHQLNAELERGVEIEEGRPRAEHEIQLEPRAEPKPPKTA